MNNLFEEVTVYDYDDENLCFRKRFPKSLLIEVIDESDKLLIRSKNDNTNCNNQSNNNHNSLNTLFSLEVYRDTPCFEFSKNGFVITDENGKTVLLRFFQKTSWNQEKTLYKETDFCRFNKMVNDFKSGRPESIFTMRTDEASATQYFQFYGYLSQQQNMMQDYIRTSTYQRAILSNGEDFRNKVVLDVGAGSGILSFFAIQAGARKVYAVEASSMAKHAKELVESNKLDDRIIVIPGKIEEINLPEQVDVIISEPMGYMLFNERMLETYLHAKKWLKPEGNMFPTRGDLHIAPFSDAQLYTEQLTKANFWFQQNFHGVDLTALRNAALKEYFYQPVVDTFDVRICIAKSNKYTVDFLKAHERDLHVINIPLKFHITQTDEIHGLAFWFDVAFFGSQQTVWLSTAPTQPLTHWYQVRCLMHKPLFVQRGHTVSGRVVLVSNRRQSYNVQIDLQVDEIPDSHASNSLDLKNPYFRYTGQPIQPPPGCNQTSPSEDYWQQLDLQQQQQQQMTNGGATGVMNGLGVGMINGNLPIVNQQTTGPSPSDPTHHPFMAINNSTPIQQQVANNHHHSAGTVNNRVFSNSGQDPSLVAAASPLGSNAVYHHSPQMIIGQNSTMTANNGMMVGPSPQQQQQMTLTNSPTGASLFNNPSGQTAASHSVAAVTNMNNFPINQSLMIGDYAAALSLPPYKPL